MVGDVPVTAIYDGFFTRPLKGFIKDVPLEEVQAHMRNVHLPEDDYLSFYTTFVAEIGDRVVLFDTGNGDARPPSTGEMVNNLKAAGYTPEGITDVMISHFHSDHINGLRLKDGTEVFAKATVHVPAPEYDFWMSAENMAAMPKRAGLFKNAHRVFDNYAGKLDKFEPGAEVIPGVKSIAAFGHTPGHTIYAISSNGQRWIYCGDAVHNPLIFARNPDWEIIFAMSIDGARKTRRALLDMAAKENTQLAFAHGAYPSTGFISSRGDGYEMLPALFFHMR